MAILDLIAQYDIELSAKLVAWLQLAGVSVAIYGPRIAVIVAARKVKRPAASSGPASGAAAGAPKMDFSGDVKAT